jgi:hypothetical protein
MAGFEVTTEALMAELLEAEHARLTVGIRHTFHREYRDELHCGLGLVEGLLKRVGKVHSIMAVGVTGILVDLPRERPRGRFFAHVKAGSEELQATLRGSYACDLRLVFLSQKSAQE